MQVRTNFQMGISSFVPQCKSQGPRPYKEASSILTLKLFPSQSMWNDLSVDRDVKWIDQLALRDGGVMDHVVPLLWPAPSKGAVF